MKPLNTDRSDRSGLLDICAELEFVFLTEFLTEVTPTFVFHHSACSPFIMFFVSLNAVFLSSLKFLLYSVNFSAGFFACKYKPDLEYYFHIFINFTYFYIFYTGFYCKIWLLAIIYQKYRIARLFWAITANAPNKVLRITTIIGVVIIGVGF